MRDKWLLLLGKWLIMFGEGIQAVALPIVVYNFTQSSELLSLAFIFETIPWIFCAPFIILIVTEKFSVKQIYIICSYLRAVLIFLIPYLIKSSILVSVLFFFLGILNSMSSSIFSTFLKNNLEDKHLNKLLGFSMGIDDALNIVAPICVTIGITRHISAVTFIYIDSVLLFFAATLTFLVPYVEISIKGNDRKSDIFKESFILTIKKKIVNVMNKNTKYLLISECSRSIVEGMCLPLLLIYVINILGHTEETYTYGKIIGSVAQVLISFVYILMVKHMSTTRIINIGTMLIFISLICLFLGYGIKTYLISMVLFGFGTAIRQLIGANIFISSFSETELSSNLSIINSIIASSYLVGYCISFAQPFLIPLRIYIIICSLLIILPLLFKKWLLSNSTDKKI